MILDKLDRILESSNSYMGEEVQDVTVEELYESAILEPAKDWYRLQSALFMTDIQLEESALNTRMDGYLGESVTESATEIEILAEAAATGFKEKAKELFTKIKNKVVEWAKRAWSVISSFFMGGEKFLKKYKAEIIARAKSHPDLECKLPNITISTIVKGTGVVNMLFKKAQGQITSLMKDGSVNIPENNEEVYSALYSDAKSLSDIKDGIKKVFYASEKKSKGKPDVNESITVIEKYGKAYLKTLKERKDSISKQCDECVNIKSSNDSDINKKVGYAKTVVNCATTAMGVEYDMIKKAGSQHEAVLKKIFRARTKKEKEDLKKTETKTTSESYIFSMDPDEVYDFSEL